MNKIKVSIVLNIPKYISRFAYGIYNKNLIFFFLFFDNTIYKIYFIFKLLSKIENFNVQSFFLFLIFAFLHENTHKLTFFCWSNYKRK